MKKEKVYFIYVTENLINGKLYIGQHTCDYDKQFTDGYLGSGIAFKNAVKKYGVENFSRIIIDYADSPEELNELEAKYVDEEVIESNRFYNLETGGKCNNNVSEETKQKISIALKGHFVSEETKQKMSIRMSGENNPMFGRIGQLNHFYGRHHTDETKQALRNYRLGKHQTEETKNKLKELFTGRFVSEETKKKMSESAKGKKHFLGLHHTEETKKKMSIRMSGENNPMFGKSGENNPMFGKSGVNNPIFGKHWFNNGIICVRAEECPEGFTKGRLPFKRNI